MINGVQIRIKVNENVSYLTAEANRVRLWADLAS